MTTSPDPDNLSGIEDWITEFQLATVYDPSSATLDGRSLRDYHFIARIASNGPDSAADVELVMGDQGLRALLLQAWTNEPPSQLLREHLAASHGGELLKLLELDMAGEPTEIASVRQGPASWFAQATSVAFERQSAHAASTTHDPLLISKRDDGLKVTVEARGSTGAFTIHVIGDPGQDERVIAIRLVGTSDAVLLVPLLRDQGRAILTVPMTEEFEFASLTGVGTWSDADLSADAAAIIERSVRVCDGNTQRVWQALARNAGPDSDLRLAIVAGLT